jgi:hypothetical protein
MPAKSRNARPESLTRYPTAAPEFFESFPSRPSAPFSEVFNSLPYALSFIGVRRKVQQSLIGFGILHDRFGLSVDSKNQRFSRLFQMFQEFRRIAAKCRHGLNVFFDIEHGGLELRS